MFTLNFGSGILVSSCRIHRAKVFRFTPNVLQWSIVCPITFLILKVKDQGQECENREIAEIFFGP